MTPRLRILSALSVLTFAALAVPALATFAEIAFGTGPMPARGHPDRPALPKTPGEAPGFVGKATYFAEEGFWAKENFVSLRGAVVAGAMGQSPVSQVAFGRDGETLFLRGGATLDDRLRREAFGPAAAERLCRAIMAERDAARALGADYRLVVGPNKLSVLPDRAPEWLAEAGSGTPSRLDRLRETHCAPLVPDLRAVLRAASEAGQAPYYRTDTHWNAYGAALAWHEVRGDGDGPTPHPLRLPRGGDLARMIGRKDAMAEESATIAPDPRIRCVRSDDAPYAPDELDPVRADEIACDGPGTGRAVVIMDSFGVSLIPSIAGDHERAVFWWREDVPWDAVARAEPSLVVRVVVERNLGQWGPSAKAGVAADGD